MVKKNKTQYRDINNCNWNRLSIVPILLLLCLILLTNSCQNFQKELPLFQRLTSQKTGIAFQNEIIEDEVNNILNFTNLYTGSGVGIGDFDKDGQPDIYFGGCMESSRLYLNKGKFKFEDITNKAGVETDRWITGVTIGDINADGWEDIYLSVSGAQTGMKRKNLLFLNQGMTNGGLSFKEAAEEMGIADSSQCTHASYLDYDKDGDLDLFLIINPTDYKLNNVNNIRRKKVNGEAASTDKLYRNNGDGTFTDVSRTAGILIEGYSLSMNVSDLNNDGWSDIYITNDFLSNDILYINNQDGTFTNQAAEKLKHTSFASMGIDVADINNDGQPEIYVLDMFPEDNYRQKMIMSGDNYDRFQYMIQRGYQPQYSRNTLQLNNGDGTFSEIGQLLDIHKTDWSWSALLADYDNDGFRDLYVTNGFRRDLGNLDFINYQNTNAFGSPEARRKEQLAKINAQPGAKIPNYIFRNTGGLGFEKKSIEWGIAESSYSHGAAYSDLDLDGDLDLVVNNVSQEAFIYENKANELTNNHYLKIKLIGTTQNPNALGAKVWLYKNTTIQFAEQTIYKGYESSIDPILHFGLGKITALDSIKVKFADGKITVTKNVRVDTLIVFSNEMSTHSFENEEPSLVNINEPLPDFQEVKGGVGLQFLHQEDLQIDFKVQPLLPHQHSQLGPVMAKGDINGDGLEDVFIGGAAGKNASFFIQKSSGLFKREDWLLDEQYEDANALFFDIDGDEDLDLYICSGGVVFSNDPSIYQDRLYLNDGMGNFSKIKNGLPDMPTSTKAIVANDFDEDGDEDLFVGGRVSPNVYPEIPQSYLLENQNGLFIDVTEKKAPKLSQIGMITDAIWSDYDNDRDLDLLLVGEWMPITIFNNNKGNFTHHTTSLTNHSNGWWNCIEQGDFDGDGDLDYLAGNLGLNTNYKTSIEEPVCIYANDFDKNGQVDLVMCQYIEGVEYPIPSRDKLITQIPAIKVRFNNYSKYADASFSQVFKGRELEDVQVLKSQTFSSSYIKNLGDGVLEISSLPIEMQMAPINDFLIKDFNQDGALDALAIGNSNSTEVSIGQYDAFTGAVMFGNGTGSFSIRRGRETGFLADKFAKQILSINVGVKKETLILVGNNQDSLQVFKSVKNE